ncbi:MAG: AAA family ATPase [Kiritimatiellia bacterium]
MSTATTPQKMAPAEARPATPPLTFTPDQREALARFETFLHSAEPVFILRGAAGTGKTLLIREMAARLSDLHREAVLLAPTGRAAKVIGERAGLPGARTIHRAIYNLARLAEAPVHEGGQAEHENDTFKCFFTLAENEHPARSVFIVDEASMVGNAVSQDGEFLLFGSGRLLADLLAFVQTAPPLGQKIVFVGDPNQLPPVGESGSPALDPAVFRELFAIAPHTAELKTVLRQQAGSPILALADALRNALDDKRFTHFDIPSAPPAILTGAVGNLIPLWRELQAAGRPTLPVVVTFSNEQALNHNRAIRETLFPNQTAIQPGDRVQLVQNNYAHGTALLNGELATVLSAAPDAEPVQISIREKGGAYKPVTLSFRSVELAFDQQESPIAREQLILETLLDSPERALTADQTRALYIFFKMRHKHLKAGTPAFREALRNDPYSNALRLKYGYAMTCHKAQGGEWPAILADFQHSAAGANESFFRWAYTAVTRARQTFIALNPPHWNPLTLKRKPGVSASAESAGAVDPADLRLRLEGALEGLPLRIRLLHHHPYLCKADLADTETGAQATLAIHWNKHRIVTRAAMEKPFPPPRQATLDKALRLLEESQLSAALSSPAASAPPSSSAPSAQEVLLLTIRDRAEEVSLSIANHRFCTPYQLRVIFRDSSGASHALDFIQNGKGELTELRPCPKFGHSPQLDARIRAWFQD